MLSIQQNHEKGCWIYVDLQQEYIVNYYSQKSKITQSNEGLSFSNL